MLWQGELLFMQTTLQIDDELLLTAERVAEESGQTLSNVVEEALRLRLASWTRPSRCNGDSYIRLPSDGEGGIMPGVNIDNNAQLRDLMDGFDVDD
jgi:hypothetical protein